MNCEKQLSAKLSFSAAAEVHLAEHIFCIDDSDSSCQSEIELEEDSSNTQFMINSDVGGFPFSNKSELFRQAEHRKGILIQNRSEVLESLSNIENLILNGSPSVATNSFLVKPQESCKSNNQKRVVMEETHPLAEACHQEATLWHNEHKHDDLPSIELMDQANVSHIGENFVDLPSASSELLQRKKRFVIGLVTASVLVFIIIVVIIGKSSLIST